MNFDYAHSKLAIHILRFLFLAHMSPSCMKTSSIIAHKNMLLSIHLLFLSHRHCIPTFLPVLYGKLTLLLWDDAILPLPPPKIRLNRPAGPLNMQYRNVTEKAPFHHILSWSSIRWESTQYPCNATLHKANLYRLLHALRFYDFLWPKYTCLLSAKLQRYWKFR